MSRVTVFVCADEDGVVVLGILVDQPAVGEVIYNVPVDAPLFYEVGIDPPHIFVRRRKFERLILPPSIFADRYNRRVAPQQEVDRVGIIQTVMFSHEIYRRAAFLLILVIQ